MVELLAAGERFAQRGLSAQIALDPFDGQILDILEVGSGAGQDAPEVAPSSGPSATCVAAASSLRGANVNAAVDQCAYHCAADKSGCTSDESFHDEERMANSV